MAEEKAVTEYTFSDKLLKCFYEADFFDPCKVASVLWTKDALPKDAIEQIKRRNSRLDSCLELDNWLKSRTGYPKSVLESLIEAFHVLGWTCLANKAKEEWEQQFPSKRLTLCLNKPYELGAHSSLNSAIQNLRKVYIEDCEIISDHWMHFFENDITDSLKLGQSYIDLAIVEESSQRVQATAVETYQDLFNKCIPGRIIVEGDAGMGKSTYCHKLALNWANGDEWLNESFKCLILIRLGELQPGDTVDSFINPQLPRGNRIENLIDQDTLFILDGYDEFNFKEQCREIHDIIQSRSHLLATVVITTRTYDTNKIPKRSRLVKSYGFAEVVVLEHMLKNSDAERVVSPQLYKNPLFYGMSVCINHQSDELHDLVDTFCKFLVERYAKTKLHAEDPDEEADSTLVWFFEFLSHVAERFTSVNLNSGDGSKKFSEDDMQKVEHCIKIGILWKKRIRSRTFSASVPGGKLSPYNYSFPHQLFQEFFIAYSIVRQGSHQHSKTKMSQPDHKLTVEGTYFSSGFSTVHQLRALSRSLNYSSTEAALKISVPWIAHTQKIDFMTFLLGKVDGSCKMLSIRGNFRPEDVKFVAGLSTAISDIGFQICTLKLEQLHVTKQTISTLEMFEHLADLTLSKLAPSLHLKHQLEAAKLKNEESKQPPAPKMRDALTVMTEITSRETQYAILKYIFQVTPNNEVFHGANLDSNLVNNLVSALHRLVSLKKLKLIESPIFGFNAKLLRKLPLSLQSLTINNCALQENTVLELQDWMQEADSLQELEIQMTKCITSSDVLPVSFTGNLPKNLVALSLENCNLGDEHVENLSQWALKNQELEIIDLSDNEKLGSTQLGESKIQDFLSKLMQRDDKECLIGMQNVGLSEEFINRWKDEERVSLSRRAANVTVELQKFIEEYKNMEIEKREDQP